MGNAIQIKNSNPTTVYLAGPITGRSGMDVITGFEVTKAHLEALGFRVLHPMTGKGYLRTDPALKAHGYTTAESSNHAIYERDQWMVRQADVVLMNLLGAKEKSIGCMMELAWASLLGRHTVVVMGEENPHLHAFVLEAADIVFPELQAAMDYLAELVRG